MTSQSKIVGGTLLVAGTTIGAGMLALPVVTGQAGFIPSAVLFVVYWIYMTYSALLTLEANLWFKNETNLVTLTRDVLGRPGEIISWGLYLYLLYALTTAYIAGSTPIFQNIVQNVFGIHLPTWAGPLPLLGLFGTAVYFGTRTVDKVNRLLMLGLVVCYFAMLFFILPEIKLSYLMERNWPALEIGISVVATSFGFHIIIPSLSTYLHRDPVALRKCILWGSTIPLAVYLLWELLTLGVSPQESIAKAYEQGLDGATLLSNILHNSNIAFFSSTFSFFAIVTSFIGVSLSLSHFLEDGLKLQQTTLHRVLSTFLTFGPPLVIALIDPRAFLSALEYAGAFGVVILLGLIPAVMVWIGRYHQNRISHYKVVGGKFGLILTILFSITVIVIELIKKLGDVA